MIVPFPAGGPTDTLGAHIVRAHAGIARPAGRGRERDRRGRDHRRRPCRRAAPDGYTLVLGNWTSHVGPGAIYKLSYDVLTDLDAGLDALGVAAHDRRQDRIAGEGRQGADRLAQGQSRTRPRPRPSASAAPRTSASSISRPRPARSSRSCPIAAARPAMQDLVAGQIDLMCAEASQTLPHLAQRQDEGLCGDVEGALAGGARGPDHGRGGRARHVHLVLERPVGCPKARPRTSSPSSMPRWWTPWRIRPCASGSPSSAT